ncbi:hypothetical protein CEUSTIGMA_g14042.t1 [Chlamydomonas eustigma]|uniref:Copper transport protein n=1 Tax=Chlamydomonas eustigma TaxID=1157962 RepID=A0A250XUA4_9CHLO|nr:hypothetical protein CEUSTIGMA_g14042.t1 [Chlamydomonas eustigma]|eukprot:GAX86634.1 hypothetical protein CEUSTIGMA_g14042.t1 [Chlamydomonas eustigma]
MSGGHEHSGVQSESSGMQIYMLMLAAMTYNVGCFLAVPVGLVLGYVLFFDFSPSAAGVKSDGCHVRILGEE